ncbi:hypothetical protein B6I21_07220 [candidate division KSB1 bacterium 4572_119]|nr:MAG: hypothetical protein B6I21_07220 [candidate division KSB1 bacterium 4572_119]
MNFIRLLPVIFSSIMIAAHFSRAAYGVLAIVCLLLPLILFIKKRWVARAYQVLLVLGGLVWIQSLVHYAKIRSAMGESWLRLAIILGVIALFTALSALVFESKSLKERYQ